MLLEKIRQIRKTLVYQSQEVSHKVQLFRTIEQLRLMAVEDQEFEDVIKVSNKLFYIQSWSLVIMFHYLHFVKFFAFQTIKNSE